MTFDFLAMKTTSTTERRAEKEQLKEEERAKAQAIEQVCAFFTFLSPICNGHFCGSCSTVDPKRITTYGSSDAYGVLSWQIHMSFIRIRMENYLCVSIRERREIVCVCVCGLNTT